jgi:TRAP-type C4-dicarboxylate transport system permease large subunit
VLNDAGRHVQQLLGTLVPPSVTLIIFATF